MSIAIDQDDDEDDLLGEEMVDYGASSEHPCMEVNVITFSADYNIIGDDELRLLCLILVQKKWSSPNQRN
jgi:hypothetical protein